MPFKKAALAGYVDEDRGLVAELTQGGKGGHTGWRIAAVDWHIEVRVWEQYPPHGDALVAQAIDCSENFPGSTADAEAIVWDLLDALRHAPFRLKGRMNPKDIKI